MNCPVCKDSVLVMADRHGIEVDYCPQCRGVWLDRGELDKIIERSMAAGTKFEDRSYQPHDRNSRYDHDRDDDDDDDYRRHRRKRGFLGELFDFD